MSTYFPKKGDQNPQWHLIDLKGKTLGRAATEVANLLRGKKKATFTTHADMGDFVVAINAKHIRLTGKKLTDKIYYRYTGYRSGIRQVTAGDRLIKNSASLFVDAVKGMIPKGPLGYKQLKKLKVYANDTHPHSAQKAKPLDLKGL